MKRILSMLLIVLSCTCTQAQVSYGDRAFGDGNIKINVSTEKDSVYLTFIITSWKYKMSDSPKVLFRLMNDEVISLDGKIIGSSIMNDGAVMVGYVAVSSNEYVTEAKFPIAKNQIEKFSKGIKKVRINTSPKYHEKEWRRDKIGKKLYAKYKESSSDSFEDNF
ncbi:hypothetical protein [uncultured Prevotella sp.]|uniref:hypothetical protein n=1 Tax=uncultured Prevotella sp. TaxID=159272 RepID=UPI00258ABF1C|nr:hypothetical protein [uncultured Prevotella sp.]